MAALLTRKPRLVAAVALANKIARIAWAVMSKKEDFRGARGDAGLSRRRALFRGLQEHDDGTSVAPTDRDKPEFCHGVLPPES
ncbi:hypothetical protein N825_21750 [Skermanella stibiiresistens SB22]|uniref:Transposase n=1 Tax=Skermanella stibiiresistens SB22 TaxID=1385369 RepID=W9H004_9PROT|nr:hypothetical protein N825_21750 [Skermanella stibiiresistens SB22]